MMKNSSFVLLRALMQSGGQLNAIKYGHDKKKKSQFIGQVIGIGFLDLVILGLLTLMTLGYGLLGLTDIIPGLCVLTISLVSFFLTLLKTNGYLFNFKEFDMLMSLPLEAKTVAGCKFLYMYLKSLPFNVLVAVSMLISYGVFAKPAWWTYIIWLLLSLLIPVIPMLLAAFFGFLAAKFSSGFKKKNIIQTVLIFIGVLAAMFSRFFIQSLFEDEKGLELLENIAEPIHKTIDVYLPAKWFELAVTGKLWAFLLLVAVCVLLFEAVFFVVGRSYREINSKLKSHAAAKKFKMTEQKTKSVVRSVAYKELKRMTGSPVYITNACVGELLVAILAIVSLFVDPVTMIGAVANGVEFGVERLYSAIPLIIYFMLGMVSTCYMSPSLEGKYYWIVSSLPISKKDLYKGKMLFNMYLTVPFMIFSTICFGISTHMPLPAVLLALITGFFLLCFSTAWGCVCGIKHLRLDWENEVEVIKQGSAGTLYMLPNMIVTMILMGVTIALGTTLNPYIVMAVLSLVSGLMAFFSYRRVISLAKD